MKFAELEQKAAARLGERLKYQYCYYLEFDYSILSEILSRRKAGAHSDTRYSESYIMFDTETSKDHEPVRGAFGRWIPQANHICAWTISIRAFHTTICTLRGTKPSELMHCISLIRKYIKADIIYIFAHNLPYDWHFCRRFFIEEFGKPKKQLNIKNHYPLTIKFNNGIVLRDSLILAGMSLDKWAKNLGVPTQKTHGWLYDEIRDQNHIFTSDELEYIEHDVKAGVECLNKLADMLGDTVVSLPFTNTGIVRRIVRKEGKKNYAKTEFFNKIQGDYREFLMESDIFHGGYTHSNRYKNGYITSDVDCGDIKSSYPFCMITEPVPCSAFMPVTRNMDPYEIYEKSYKSAYMFKLVLNNVRLRDPHFPMPCLQYSKCDSVINVIKDNGRILYADFLSIRINEIDLRLIYDIYEWDSGIATEVYVAGKDYMPKWYRDIVFDTFREKCELEYQVKILKTGDKSAYNQCKSRLNSLYGMCVTKPVKETICEFYEDSETEVSGEYYIDDCDIEKEYEKYLKNRSEILPYSWGCWITSAAMFNIFTIAMRCIKDINFHWIYTDTDSCYSDKWDHHAIEEYNNEVKEKLTRAGYGGVYIHDQVYWLGVLEHDGHYKRFISQGAKRYAVEYDDGHIGITVAGVPKDKGGASLKCLEDFEDGYIFRGEDTGKKLHTYMYSEIYIDDRGNECADSIDLSPCDYKLSVVDNPLKIDELLIIDENGDIIINDNETVYYDWFEE